jgi:hypothetical protein
MPQHEVVVCSVDLPGLAVGETESWHVAVCFTYPCLWRGRVWDRAQTAVDEANVHRHETKDPA